MRNSSIAFLFLAPLLSCALLGGCRADDTEGNGGNGTSAGGTGGSTASTPLPLQVVTWNVHNLVDDRIDGAPQEWLENSAVWEAHRQAVGTVLSAIDADVVVLQEVEHLGVLSELNEQDLGNRYDRLVIVDGNDPRGIDIGVMSKLPVDRFVSHAADEFTVVGQPAPVYSYSRDCLEVHITHNGRALVLLGVHYKAKDNDNPDKRLAEAQHTRAIADDIGAAAPGTGVLILGDFNDTPGSTPYDWTLGLVPGGPTERYTASADSVPQADRWSFDYLGNRELVDHQIANPLLAGMLDPQAVEIWHTPEVAAASDHAPVIATYLVN